MADVVLVFPKTGFDIKKVSIDLPLALLSASSYVAQDHEVKIIDQRLDPQWENTLKEELKKEPLVVGVSSLTGPQIEHGIHASRIVKESGARSKVIWGGVHATLLTEQTVSHPLVDIVVAGEGELTFRDLVAALEKGKDLSDVKGIAFKKDGRVVRTPPQEPVDLNELPELPYNLVDVEQYVGSQGRFPQESARSLIFISSRGCPWRCTYCCNPRLSQRRWRSMTAEKTYERVSKLVEKYRLDSITFHDEEFLVDKNRAEQAARLIGGKFQWWIQGRMDLIKKADLDILEKGGLCAVQPGIESGAPRILELIHKGEGVEDFLEANRRMAQTDIRPLYNFMMGFPTETYDEVMQSVDLSLRLLKENPKAQLSGFYVCVPYPGTDLFDLAIKEGFTIPDSLEGWASFNRQHLNTPWIQGRLPLFQSIMLTSRFIDSSRLGTRLEAAFQGLPVPLIRTTMVGRFYRRRWRKRVFQPKFDAAVNRGVLFLFSLSQTRPVRWLARAWQRRPWHRVGSAH